MIKREWLMPTTKLSRFEESLLLFLETEAVDHSGYVRNDCLSDEDHKTIKRWCREGFIEFGRLPAAVCRKRSGTRGSECFWVCLSAEAWSVAAAARRERGGRGVIRLQRELAPYQHYPGVRQLFKEQLNEEV